MEEKEQRRKMRSIYYYVNKFDDVEEKEPRRKMHAGMFCMPSADTGSQREKQEQTR